MKSFANFGSDGRFTAKLKSLKKIIACFSEIDTFLCFAEGFFARCALHENLFIWVRKASPEGSEKGRRQMLISGLRALFIFPNVEPREARRHTIERRTN
jgi:hypothetical protein